MDLISHFLAHLFNLLFSNGIFFLFALKLQKKYPAIKEAIPPNLLTSDLYYLYFLHYQRYLKELCALGWFHLLISSEFRSFIMPFGFRSHMGRQYAIAKFVNFVANKSNKYEDV